MKKHREYLLNGTALVTLFVEAAITRARGARIKNYPRTGVLDPVEYVNSATTPEERRIRKSQMFSMHYGGKGTLFDTMSLVKELYPSSFNA